MTEKILKTCALFLVVGATAWLMTLMGLSQGYINLFVLVVFLVVLFSLI